MKINMTFADSQLPNLLEFPPVAIILKVPPCGVIMLSR